ncbi:hypothetical protein WJR50_23680 [Catalinimonas sp. 4WD22]|uniref:hypothetical protein n=1 Tax=Catalinimonas locisalis TaxID=3133978 RepID=UPI00310150D2
MKASCQSLVSQFINVIGGFIDDYQELRKTAAKIFVDTIIPGKPGSEKELDKLIDQAIDLETKLLKSYGVAVGQGKGKIGPRYLIIPTKKVTGDLLTERTFAVAPSLFDKVTITIKKTGGKAGADIAACAKYANGAHFNEKRKSIDKGKDSQGDSVKFVFTDMAEKALTIHLVQTGFPTDTCDYYLTMEGEFDQKEMEKLAPKGATHGAVRAS